MSPFGHPRVHHRVLDSTNERAKELARAGAPHGTVVTADEQSAGRGRQGRMWVAPPGAALLMSVIVRDLDERFSLLPLAAAVAVCEAAEATVEISCAIKWPNDVWVNRRKLAGILIEARRQEGVGVIGIGLNVTTRAEDFPEELRERATSLALESAAADPPTTDTVLRALVCALQARVEDDPARILETWRTRDALRGHEVSWNGGTGTASGVDESGALQVKTEGGTVSLDAGEVHMRAGQEPAARKPGQAR